HATDPASGNILNAFDVDRLHLFQDLDDKASYSTEVTKLPSFKAMTDFALKNEIVKEQIAEERKEQAEIEFTEDDWEGQLDLDKTGAVKNTLRNLTLILEHDENLQGIVFNELSDSLEIVSPVPSSHPSKYWRDA